MAAIVGVVAVVVIQALTGSIDQTGWGAAEKGFMDVIPIVIAASAILGTFAFIGGGPAAVTYIRYKRWEQFGIRLKLAYEAKFGYSNPAFNEEVDCLVLTKEQNESRLKRLARFVEVKFVIPEEERLAETVKTEMLARGYERAHEAFHVSHNHNFREQLEAKMVQDPTFIGSVVSGVIGAALATEGATRLKSRAESSPAYKPDAGYEEEVYVKKPVLEPIIFFEPEKVAVTAVKKHSGQARHSNEAVLDRRPYGDNYN